MELKEYLRIIKKDIKVFLAIVGAVVIAAAAYFYLRPTTFSTSLTLDVTRKGAQDTADYKYDGFYRIQADEKFAETVVQWLKSPRVIAEVMKEADMNSQDMSLKKLSKVVKPEKMSSQVISVTYSSSDPKTAQNMATALQKIISKNTDNLNKDQREDAWFEVVAHDHITKRDIFNPVMILIVAVLIGIFAAFWVVMIRHYLN